VLVSRARGLLNPRDVLSLNEWREYMLKEVEGSQMILVHLLSLGLQNSMGGILLEEGARAAAVGNFGGREVYWEMEVRIGNVARRASVRVGSGTL
jgi:hypothetical protein